MNDGQWRLVYPGTDLLWSGTGATPLHYMAVDLGDAEVRAADVERQGGDGLQMGRDFRGGRTLTFELGIDATPASVHDLMDELAAAWDAGAIRDDPGAVAELRCAYRGQERVVYGRPRRLALDGREHIWGRAEAIADFRAVDHRFYDVHEQQVSTGLVAATGGGVTSPLASPLATTGQTDRSTVMDVSSPYPVWPVVTITGPVIDPEVEILGVWRIKVRTALAYDETLTIDTRPWRPRIVTDPGGRNTRGSATRDSVPLTRASVPRGRHEVAFRGRADTGAPGLSIRWQNAHAAP